MPAPESLKEAGRRVGCSVEIVDVASNEDLAAAMETAPFDLVFPSDYLVERLAAGGALAPLDPAILPLDRLAGWAREASYDPGCRHSVPFAYGTTGVLAGPRAPVGVGWGVILDPAGPVQMLDEVREVFGAALIAGGHDPNQLDGAPFEEAMATLRRQRQGVTRFDSADFIGPVVAGQVVAAHAWSGPAAAAVRRHEGLRYFVPDEGAVLWVTTGAIPAGAPDPDRSMRLLVELMDPKLAALTTVSFGYATPNEPARALLPAAIGDDLALFPCSATIARCRPLRDLRQGDALQLDRGWRELRESRPRVSPAAPPRPRGRSGGPRRSR